MFERLHNFRQAGGDSCVHNRYGQKMKEQLLYRSSRTDLMTEEDADKFMQLGVKSIIDLRAEDEYKKTRGNVIGRLYAPHIIKNGEVRSQGKDDGSQKQYFANLLTREYLMGVYGRVNVFARCITPAMLLVDWLFECHLALKMFSYLVINHQTLAEWYVDVLEHSKPQVAAILRLLLDEDRLPVLINCAHGKDRTGMIVALILGCLEVEDDVIVQDYSMSEAGLAPIRSTLVKHAIGKHGFNLEFTLADAQTMRDLLSELSKRYGGVCGYLSAAGFTADEQQALKNVFLESCSNN